MNVQKAWRVTLFTSYVYFQKEYVYIQDIDLYNTCLTVIVAMPQIK